MANQTPANTGVIALSLLNTPDDVQCLELDVMGTSGLVALQTPRFDVTPGQPTTITVTGLPLEWVLLAEKTYNCPCSQVSSSTPVTWFSPTSKSVQLVNGVPVDVTVVLHPASGPGGLNVTNDFQVAPQTCTGWTCSPWSYGTGNGCNCNCGCWDPDCDPIQASDGGSVSDAGSKGRTVTVPSGCILGQACVQPGVCQNIATCTGWICQTYYYGDGYCDFNCGCPDPDCAGIDAGVDAPIGRDGKMDVPPDASGQCSTCAWGQTFESNDGGFTVSGSLATWEWGVPIGGPAPMNGPSAAHSGGKVWATNLSGNYRANEDSYLTSSVIDLSAYAGRAITASWWEYSYMEATGAVEVSKDRGATWTSIHTVNYAYTNGWTRNAIIIDSSYAVSDFMLRFHFTASSNINTYAGWYIDDICVAPGGMGAYKADFEASDGGYTTSGSTSWAWGTPTSGPGSANSGTKAWGTGLHGNYGLNEDGYLTSPLIDLRALATASSLELHWWAYLQSEPNYDFANVEVSADGGGSWTLVAGPASGYAVSGWQPQSVSLATAYAVANFRVRFHFTSDSANNYAGWYVDDVSVQGSSLNSCDPASDTPNIDGGAGGVYDAGVRQDSAGGSPQPDAGTDAVVGGNCSTCVWGQTFESNNGGFMASGALSSWEWGVPQSNPCPDLGNLNVSAYRGGKVWSTGLTNCAKANQDSYLTSPIIDLRTLAGRAITINWQQIAYYNQMDVDVSKDGGNTWTSAYSLYNQWINTWTRASFVVDSSFAVADFRFRFHTSYSSGNLGWYVDDVCIAPAGLGTYHNDFEANNGGFTTGGTTSWAWGTTNKWYYYPSLGLIGNVWATGLESNYGNNENGYLTSPPIDLTRLAGEPSLNLVWWQAYQGEPGYDFGSVEVSANGGLSWDLVYGPFSNYNYYGSQVGVTLGTNYAVPDFRFRFHFTSDASNTSMGWLLDNVTIQGTSMPACDPSTDTPNLPCECYGTGPSGPVTVACGQSACGSDYHMYSCGTAGWSATGQACAGAPDAGATVDTGSCQCSGTGPGGTPITVSCGQSACGSDYQTYSCGSSGWSSTGQACSVGADAGSAVDTGVCQCSGTGPGGTPISVSCGQSACGSDYQTYSCGSSGWSGTGSPCQ